MTSLGRFLVGACAGGVLFCLAAPAHADTKLELGLRTGYGIPFGNLAGGGAGKVNDLIAGQIPLWLDVGARFSDHYYLGLYYSYGFGINGSAFSDDCKAAGSDVSCSTSDMRLGIQYAYHLKPPGELDPWLGIGVGYEWLKASESVGGISASTTAHGWEFVNLQLGLDVPVADHFTVGPFVTFGLAQYSNVAIATTIGDASGEVNDKALHEWLFLGVRGTFLL
jgi:hypothetical protein